MKVVHTSDWHMGLRLGFIDRTSDIARAVAQIATIIQDRNADVLLICGDLFDGSTRTELVRYWMEHLSGTLGDFLRGGGTVLALTGNHDNENLAQALRQAMALAAPEKHPRGGLLTPGRFYLFSGPTFFRLPDRTSPGHAVQFVVMPWPTPARYLDEKAQKFTSQDERNRALKTEFKRVLDTVASDPAYDAGRHTILAAHIMTSGAEVREGVTLGEAEAVVLQDGELPTGYAYVALGDVHRPQTLMDLPHVRYCGSIDRMDLGESGEQKGVVLVEVGPEGRRGEPEWVPLDATPIYKVRIESPNPQLDGLADEYPDHETALVRLSIRYEPGKDNLPDLLSKLDKIFPRCYARDYEEVGGVQDGGTKRIDSNQPLPAVVRSFLKDRLAGDPEQEELIRLADALIEQLP